jgi:hypothetical protein
LVVGFAWNIEAIFPLPKQRIAYGQIRNTKYLLIRGISVIRGKVWSFV